MKGASTVVVAIDKDNYTFNFVHKHFRRSEKKKMSSKSVHLENLDKSYDDEEEEVSRKVNCSGDKR